MLRNIHRYGKTEDVMEKTDHARKGRIMNIKENFYIYMHNQNNKLIDEQKTNEDNHKNILFDVAMAYIDMPPIKIAHAHTYHHRPTRSRSISSPQYPLHTTTATTTKHIHGVLQVNILPHRQYSSRPKQKRI
jgi:hypothetical protein